MPTDDGLGRHENQVGAPVFTEALQDDPEDPVPRSEPGPSATPAEDRQLLAEGQVLQGQPGAAPNQATQNEEDSPEHGHPRLPWVLDLVEKGWQEYAGQVTDTQAWCGGWNSREYRNSRFQSRRNRYG